LLLSETLKSASILAIFSFWGSGAAAYCLERIPTLCEKIINMVSFTELTHKRVAFNSQKAKLPKRRRFRLLAALAAPFIDIDERAVRRGNPKRNISKGNTFTR
jgi:hypothetical protein